MDTSTGADMGTNDGDCRQQHSVCRIQPKLVEISSAIERSRTVTFREQPEGPATVNTKAGTQATRRNAAFSER
jgi:hypothetical protein